jgi:lysylphosphatidylglycerol synthetase-like protein (DUF2156 family)
VLAACTFIDGVVLLFLKLHADKLHWLHWVETVFPLAIIETSRLIGSMAAMLLLFAYDLQQRVR